MSHYPHHNPHHLLQEPWQSRNLSPFSQPPKRILRAPFGGRIPRYFFDQTRSKQAYWNIPFDNVKMFHLENIKTLQSKCLIKWHVCAEYCYYFSSILVVFFFFSLTFPWNCSKNRIGRQEKKKSNQKIFFWLLIVLIFFYCKWLHAWKYFQALFN